MFLASFILFALVMFLLVNGGTLANPMKWICNVLLAVAVILYLYASYGLPR